MWFSSTPNTSIKSLGGKMIPLINYTELFFFRSFSAIKFIVVDVSRRWKCSPRDTLCTCSNLCVCSVRLNSLSQLFALIEKKKYERSENTGGCFKFVSVSSRRRTFVIIASLSSVTPTWLLLASSGTSLFLHWKEPWHEPWLPFDSWLVSC